ncbi:Cullin-domain-containing protein [Cystobasidium minutum MCA 4210]|uniref:Cullin-domain-containing protein n=1 Tax=Cystobasidium minutum MCA 4210 TaxID=1397322 RepID=UPI0034CE8D9E|eukprot:jgi/Rhomi1/29838/CE29837_101
MTLLTYYSQEWDRYTQSARVLNNIFSYINRHYVHTERDQGDRGIYPVYHIALVQWYDIVFCGLQGASQIPINIIKLINQERDGFLVDSFTIRKAIESLITLSIDRIDYTRRNLHLYTINFLQPFLKATQEYYVLESTEFLLKNPVEVYVEKAVVRLEQEEARGLMYLHASSLREHKAAYRQALIGTHLATFQTFFGAMLRQENRHYLRRTFQLVSLFPDSMEAVRADFRLHIEREGSRILAAIVTADSTDDAGQYVGAIADLHGNFRNLLLNSLEDDKTLQAVMDKAFVVLVNDNEAAAGSAKSAELVARFADFHLRKTSKAPSALDTDVAIDRAMLAFAYLEDKDVFQKVYIKYLARRLIHGTSVSDEAEGQMVSRLKTACGAEYTSDMSRMISDLLISADINTAFQSHVGSTATFNKQLEFTPLLLSHNVWPLSPAKTDFTIPKDLRKLEEQFKLFYLSKYNGRKITWLHHHSRNEVRMTYTAVKHVLSCSTYQASILLQFNESESLSYADIQIGTGLSTEISQPNLSLLVKQKILLREDKNMYKLNRNFKHSKLRVNINVPLKADVKTDNAHILQQTTEDRKIEIQLVLVCIMKARKTSTQSQLINEVVDQLSKRFVPQVNDIKRQIDWLIDNEYLERGEDRAILKYLA